MAPSLSVVVCSLGTAPVERAVQSVVDAGREAAVDVDVVVVWQAPTAPPAFGAAVRVARTFPVGLSYARNRGLALAAAPVVGFVDDDEVVDHAWVGGILAAFAAAPEASAVFGEVAPLDGDGIPYCVVSGEQPRLFRRPSMPPWVIGTGGNMAFRRELLLALGGFDASLGAGAPGQSAEESDVIVRLLRAGAQIAFTPDAVVYHPTKSAAEHLASRRPYAHGVGAMARRRRDPGVAARYAAAAAQSWARGVRSRNRQRRREALRTIGGLLAGLAARPVYSSPERLLEWLPPEIAGHLDGRPLRPGRAVYGPTPEFAFLDGTRTLRIVVGEDGASRAGFEPPGAVVVTEGDATWILDA